MVYSIDVANAAHAARHAAGGPDPVAPAAIGAATAVALTAEAVTARAAEVTAQATANAAVGIAIVLGA